MSEQTAEKDTWKPGDKARILFPDGTRRAAELTPGFVWVTPDGAHTLAAESGFDAEPLLRPIRPGLTRRYDYREHADWRGQMGLR